VQGDDGGDRQHAEDVDGLDAVVGLLWLCHLGSEITEMQLSRPHV
jgi:hypothetical protein